MSKRKRLIVASIIITAGFIITQIIDIRFRYLMIIILDLFAYGITALVLKEDLKKISLLVVLPQPVLYITTASLFYYLLPTSMIIRIIIFILFAIGLYAVLLTQNIYCIASNFHTIQLLRAAQAVGFLLTLMIAFFGFNSIFSYKLEPWFNGIFALVLSFFLVFSSMWSIILTQNLSRRLIINAAVLAVIMGEVSYIISFWPLSITSSSLFLVSFLYVILGIFQNHLSERLFQKTLKEYLQVGLVIFIITYLLAHWR